MSSSAQSFSAVVFDVDGTLVDTEEEWDVVRRRLAAEDGVPWPESSTKAMMGMSTPEWSAHLSEVVGLRGSPEECARRTIDGMRELYREGVTILPGAREAVVRMRQLGSIAMASSSPSVLIEAAIEALGLQDVVDAYVSTEQVERGKPAPDAYLRCCELLGVDPADCLAVEDSTPGITSALAAGMSVVAVPQAFHGPDEELLGRCAAVLDSLEQLTPELVTGLATRRV